MVVIGESPIYRLGRLEDIPFIVDMNLKLAKETENVELKPEVVLEGVNGVMTDSSKGRYYVVEVGGVVVGQLMLTFEWSDWRNAQVWWIQSVYVESNYRKRGYFKALYELVKRESIEEGSCGLRLYVDTSNTSAINTYQTLGMTSHYHVYEDLFCNTA